ncbi:hypothetical protein SAMN04487846_2685 [Microbacterium sp. cf046]|uniref:hypothetical protein n=1 Tax=Microbacterium sp. cf046 TaxID=1761803 RepID=UPI0008E65EC8|nr:hypothetical protein [Microbacterium sp. cf046]SFS13431.1 hypothetical protein SAMN04487846_2685 [Microbacterium sp. cf046]
MDAAARAELDALRLRAYGPSPDIADDCRAVERLVELEELALPAARMPEPGILASAPASGLPPDGAVVDGPRDAAPSDARVVGVLPAGESPRRRRSRWHIALVAAVAIVALPLGVAAAARTSAQPAVSSAAAGAIPAGVREALAFVRHPQADKLIEVRIDGSFGDYVDLPIGDDVPVFPVEGLMTWVEPLGDYYGWKLWIAGARGAIENENCMLLDGDGTMRADCVSTALKTQGGLLLSVPYAELAPEDRPEVMTADQSLGFWWGPDGVVTILLSPTPPD